MTTNFFGTDSENGTGEILVNGHYLRWRPDPVFQALGMKSAAKALRNSELRFFGMWAWVLSRQQSDDPLENKHDRTYLKWGVEPLYQPTSGWWSSLYFSLRFDRVILDTNHESLSFRVISPKIGVSPTEGFQIFCLYSRYAYGENIDLRKNQIPKDSAVVKPDQDYFKIQAQVVW